MLSTVFWTRRKGIFSKDNMAQSIQKWLVIDASVGGMTGSGIVAEDTPQGKCRRCLRTVRANQYGVFFHPQTWEEWRRHRSEYAKEWLQQMYSRKAVTIKREDKIPESVLSLRIQQLTGKKIGMEILSEAVCTIMLKDCHLLEASLAADNIIVSLDDKVRFHFTAAAESIGEIRGIVWVNPNKEYEEVIAWLEAGAKLEKQRTLGNMKS
jgi:hypothetical protein